MRKKYKNIKKSSTKRIRMKNITVTTINYMAFVKNKFWKPAGIQYA